MPPHTHPGGSAVSLSPRQQDQLVFYALGLMAVLFMLTIICANPR